jgi:hypothetical protein
VGDLGAAQDEADLRPVAVRQHHVPAAGDHRRHVAGGDADRVVLVRQRHVPVVHDQCIAAHRDHGQWFHWTPSVLRTAYGVREERNRTKEG